MQTVSGSFGVAGYAIATIFDNYVLIYTSAIVVLLFTIIPPLLIEEPRELLVEQTAETKKPLWELVMSVQPLWGFLIYDAYAMSLRLAGIETDHYYAEIICGALTLVLVGKVLFAKAGDDGSAAGHHLGFQKVLAAHSFSWIGIHTTFVYLIIFLQQQFPQLGDIDSGRVNSLNFLILNLVGALLPLFVLQPLALKIGRVRTHAAALAVMAVAYFALYFTDQTVMSVYVLIAFVGVGWASIVSLPFAIVSQKVQSTEMGLYMGLFNLSVVLPQLTVSLGVAMLVSRAADKDIIFLVSAVTVALSALAWTRVSDDGGSDASGPAGGGHH